MTGVALSGMHPTNAIPLQKQGLVNLLIGRQYPIPILRPYQSYFFVGVAFVGGGIGSHDRPSATRGQGKMIGEGKMFPIRQRLIVPVAFAHFEASCM